MAGSSAVAERAGAPPSVHGSPQVSSPPYAAPSTVALVLAFAAIYIVWGSTYLAIRKAVTTIPPFFMAGSRFLIAGLMMYAWARRRAPRATRAEWKGAAQVGIALLVGGNGLVCWAEQFVPSGQTALQVGTVPLWVVLMNWLFGDRRRPTVRIVGGLAAGLVGVVLLNAPALRGGAEVSLAGGIALVFACIFWSAGTIRARYVTLPRANPLASAMQMLVASAVLLVIAAARGELGSITPAALQPQALLSVGYLIVFGSMIGFSAYAWLLQVCPPARVATYAYVNPVVALMLGALFDNEKITARTVAAAVIILGAVALLSLKKR